MAKVMEANRPNGENGGYFIYCQGCKTYHLFDDRWTFNGNYEKPTFAPSMLVNRGEAKRRCHSFVRDGKIQFLNDCFHQHAGKTLDLEDVD